MKPQRDWTDEDWAANGYVRVVVNEHGISDTIYIKRSFSSPVITPHERNQIRSHAMTLHRHHLAQRASAIDKYRRVNTNAMRPYKEWAEARREEERRKAVAEGRIPLDEMTFFDLL